ncbi:Neuroligin 4-like [Orchesella cincta]|uniref:Neuroligin 4-like n=1 Tax=Orchesella cincta TaxID=48709 RepID=A0A1D2N7R2_ORCCI|nr:Neuroligin 4-like [Orchesella cincta]
MKILLIKVVDMAKAGRSTNSIRQMWFFGHGRFILHKGMSFLSPVFLNIPYASPPIKSHRFSPTQTPIPWDGVRQATKPGFVCPQMMPDISNETAALKEMPRGYFEYLRHVEPFLRNQSEDCLYLNIFAPIGCGRITFPNLWIISTSLYSVSTM